MIVPWPHAHVHAGWGAMSQGSRHQQMIQEEELRRVDLRRRMRATVVPTSDAEVRRLLRQLGEPVTLFGEQQVLILYCLQGLGTFPPLSRIAQ